MPEPKLTRVGAAPFDSWTYEDVAREMQAVIDDTTYQIRKAYAEDKDHFRSGKEWVGPGDATTNTDIQNQFAPEDAVGEVLSNIGNAFSEPQLGITPVAETGPTATIAEATKAEMDKVVGMLTRWWDKQRLQEHIQSRQRLGAWAGMAALRLWVPTRFLLKDAENRIFLRQATDVEEALSFIRVSAPLPESCMVLTDPGTQDLVAVFKGTDVEWIGPDGDKEKKTYQYAELVYLDPMRAKDEDAVTVVRKVYSGDDKPATRAELKLGGRLLVSQMEVDSLFSDPVIRTQRQLNLLTTLVTRIAETAAFRERYTKNAKPYGTRIPYTEGDDITDGAFVETDEEGRQWQVIPQARTLGANTTTELVGLPQYDPATGEFRGNQMPGVEVVDPVDPKPYLEAADATRRRILRMCGQGHLGGISNAEASGIAYEQARAVFAKDLNRRRIPEEAMLRELLTAALALAEGVAGTPGKYTSKYRLTVDQHVDPGPRSPDLVRLDLESYEAGVIGRETTMTKLGVEDIDAETGRLSTEALYILNVMEKAVAVSERLTPESFKALLEKLNLPKEVISVIEVAEKEPVVTPET